MKKTSYTTWMWIKSEVWMLVKQALRSARLTRPYRIGLYWLFLINFFFELTPLALSPQSLARADEVLPEIIAKTYTLQVAKRSHSNRVYIFKNRASEIPVPGQILLFKENDQPVMGFRVLKVYPDDNRLAAKRVRRYRKHAPLAVGESFLAVEKLRDLMPDTLTEDDAEELSEVEKETTVAKGIKSAAEDPDLASADNEEHSALTAEEGELLDPYRHWITVGVGYIRNNSPPTATGSLTGTSFFTAANLRYGYTLGKLILFKKAKVQDSFTLEGGFYSYKNLSYIVQGDSYTVLSAVGSLRYNLFFSRSFAVFFYTGVIRNQVVSSSQGQAIGTAALQNVFLTAGTGFLFQVGPSWYTRVDIGMDSIGLNLVLRF